jgi:hypothetical protein
MPIAIIMLLDEKSRRWFGWMAVDIALNPLLAMVHIELSAKKKAFPMNIRMMPLWMDVMSGVNVIDLPTLFVASTTS